MSTAKVRIRSELAKVRISQGPHCPRTNRCTKPKVRTFENFPPISQISIDNNGVLKLLKCLDVHKAMGPDCIPNIDLKHFADEILQGLCTIFLYSLNAGTLPLDWSNANVFKIGDRHFAENYSSVSLTGVYLFFVFSIQNIDYG